MAQLDIGKLEQKLQALAEASDKSIEARKMVGEINLLKENIDAKEILLEAEELWERMFVSHCMWIVVSNTI